MKGPLSRAIYPGATRKLDDDRLRRSLRPGEQLRWRETIRQERVGLIIAPPATGRDWVVFLYGNGMTLFGTWPVRDRLRAAGYGVVCVDYPGYGVSSGSPSEHGCYRAADTALGYLREDASIAAADVTLIGWSLGSAVATDLASRVGVRALVLLSPLSSLLGATLDLLRVGRTTLPLGPFNALAKASRVRCPTLIVSGANDRLTRPWMATELATALGGRVRRVDLPGVGHNDLLRSGERLWTPVIDFLRDPVG
jgi:uncharacterized protein